MAEKKTVHAPYNFVPFSDKNPLLPYASMEDLPAHDSIRADLKTGEIHVTLQAETPVFVSDGGKAANEKQNLRFFRLPNGEFAVPGSSVRGMVRENMQILGFGIIRPGADFEDQRMFFREIASARDAVGSNTKQYYRTALDIQTKRSQDTGKTYSVPANVRSGYLFREGNHYLIRPTMENRYYRVSRKHPGIAALGEQYAKVIPVFFTAGDDRVKSISVKAKTIPDEHKGMLLYTGKAAGKPNHVYLFPEPDFDAAEIALSFDDVLAYKVDLEQRKNALKGLKKTQGQQNQPDEDWLSFWELPQKNGECKPVFYMRHGGQTYFGMSAFLRIGYPHTLAEGLPLSQRDRIISADMPLDFPHAILGFAEKDCSYRSRVSFGDFPAEPGAEECKPVSMILGNPKPGYYPGYLKDGKDYTEEDFQLRGFKQYWLMDVQPTSVDPGKEKAGTTIRPLPKGSVFHGVVRFQNLTDVELGLLLWSLRLEEGCYQSIGMGKPYGYGRMKLTVEKLQILNPDVLYGTDFSACAWTDEAEHIPDYIRKYDAYAAEKLYIKKPKQCPSIKSRPEIQDFFFIKSSIRKGTDIIYMEIPEYQNIRTPLPSIEEIRKEEAAPDQAAPRKSEQTMKSDDPWAALRNFKRSL